MKLVEVLEDGFVEFVVGLLAEGFEDVEVGLEHLFAQEHLGLLLGQREPVVHERQRLFRQLHIQLRQGFLEIAQKLIQIGPTHKVNIIQLLGRQIILLLDVFRHLEDIVAVLALEFQFRG